MTTQKKKFMVLVTRLNGGSIVEMKGLSSTKSLLAHVLATNILPFKLVRFVFSLQAT